MSPCVHVHVSMSLCLHVSLLHFSMFPCLHVYFSIFPCLRLHISKSPCMFPEFRKRKTELTEDGNLRLLAANGKGKPMFVVLGRQTINGNRRLLFQQTCLFIEKCHSGFYILSFPPRGAYFFYIWLVLLFSIFY